MKMQNLFIVLITASMIIVGCKKKTQDFTGDQTESPVSYVFRYDNAEVAEGYFDLLDSELNILITAAPEEDSEAGIITIHAFTNERKYIEYGRSENIPVELMLSFDRQMSEYAETSGAIEYYEQTGELPEEYVEFEERAFPNIERVPNPLVIYKDFWGGSSRVFATTLPVMPTGWNNKVSRYFDLDVYGGLAIYDKSFYRSRMATLWNWGWQTIRFSGPLAGLNDRMSSCINY
jgi:hypothetical protein